MILKQNSYGLLLFTIFYRLVNCQNSNLALQKPTFTVPLNDPTKTLTVINDGVVNSNCAMFFGSTIYVIIDLQAVTQVNSIKVYNTFYESYYLSKFELSVTNNWRSCNSENLYTTPACSGSVIATPNNNLMMFNTTGSCNGRFVIFRLKTISNAMWAKICEFEVYGVPTTNLATTNEGSTCQPFSSSSNILLNKPVYLSNGYRQEAINDGVYETSDIWTYCYWSPVGYEQSVLIDMEDNYILSFFRIWNSLDPYQYGTYYSYNISIGTKFTLETMTTDLNNFMRIKTNAKIIGPTIEANLTNLNVVGRYIYIETQNNINDYFTLCEVEATGTLAAASPQSIYMSQPVPTITASNLTMAPAIRSGVSQVLIDAYSSGIIYTKNCEPVVWDITTYSSFGIACKYFSGNVMFFGKSGFFASLLNSPTNSLFKSNVYNFLSPNGLNAQVISQVNINSSSLGNIVFMDISKPISSQLQTILLSKLKAGNVSLVLETTYWAEMTYTYYRPNYDFVLRELMVDFSTSSITSVQKNITLSNSDYNSMFIKTEWSLERILMNDTQFLTYGENILTMLNNFQSYMVNASLITPYLVSIYQKYMPFIQYNCPSTIAPLPLGNMQAYFFAFNQLLLNPLLVNSGFKSPCVDYYPGDFSSNINIIKINPSLSISGTVAGEYHSTGLYLAAGDTFQYTVINQTGCWDVSVGCQRIGLGPARNVRDIYRMPYISVDRLCIGSSGSVFSPFGGILWIRNKQANSSINIKLTNVIQSPFFNLLDPNGRSIWEVTRTSGQGLYAELQGNHVSICVPSSVVINYSFDYLVNLFNTYWDMEFHLNSQLMAKDDLQIRKTRIVFDIQTPYRGILSGYPITLTPDLYDDTFNTNYISTSGSWGVSHEIGHTFQESILLFTGSLEVTVNIFVLFNYDAIWNWNVTNPNSRLLSSTSIQSASNLLSQTVDYNLWKSNYFFALEIFGEFAYQFGWGFYQQFFKIMRNQTSLPTATQDIIDFYALKFSYLLNLNVKPVFDFWGLPVSTQASNSLSNLVCFFPDDSFVNINPARVTLILASYNNSCVRKSQSFWSFQFQPPRTRVNDVVTF